MNHKSDKGHIHVVKNSQRKTESISNPIRKGTKDMTKHFTKENIQMANKYVKRCSTSLVIRKTEIKTMCAVRMVNTNSNNEMLVRKQRT